MKINPETTIYPTLDEKKARVVELDDMIARAPSWDPTAMALDRERQVLVHEISTETAALVEGNPLQRMVGGDHYLKLGIQPFEFAMANRWDSCAFSVLKYLSRYRHKAGKIDLEKARHITEIRHTYVQFQRPSFWDIVDIIKSNLPAWQRFGHADLRNQEITMGKYIMANDINDLDGQALLALDSYVRGFIGPTPVLAAIDGLIVEWDKSLLPSA